MDWEKVGKENWEKVGKKMRKLKNEKKDQKNVGKRKKNEKRLIEKEKKKKRLKRKKRKKMMKMEKIICICALAQCQRKMSFSAMRRHCQYFICESVILTTVKSLLFVGPRNCYGEKNWTILLVCYGRNLNREAKVQMKIASKSKLDVMFKSNDIYLYWSALLQNRFIG
ncbi:hypothetical protein RFI_21515 [Reticulomyxa filosa]|uniref:Uncharacterized protein n=1 Tax=Reticulomyxa filosa TaxID=46433 RepID=X6MPS6_RETFI|nr:hypothetical protein RFI_21515 [Reticulomyxa filosa]|eukprot:ETO15849.1 hypothetical protein RFI_21515 [Reticulomyxa filosa]